MDKSAIEAVTDNAIAAADKVSTLTRGRAVAIPNSLSIHDLEEYQLHRDRFRGVMSTSVFQEYINFVVESAKSFLPEPDEGHCFINPERMTATTFFNLGDMDAPGHGDHRARLQLKPTAPYEALQQLVDKRLSQKTLAEWIEDWSDNLVAIDADDSNMDLKRVISAIRKISIKTKSEKTSEENSFSSRRSGMAEVEANSEENLPAELIFLCEPYQGLENRRFRMRLSIITGGDEPALTLRIVRPESIQEDMAEEFRDRVVDSLRGQPINTYVGEYTP